MVLRPGMRVETGARGFKDRLPVGGQMAMKVHELVLHKQERLVMVIPALEVRGMEPPELGHPALGIPDVMPPRMPVVELVDSLPLPRVSGETPPMRRTMRPILLIQLRMQAAELVNKPQTRVRGALPELDHLELGVHGTMLPPIQAAGLAVNQAMLRTMGEVLMARVMDILTSVPMQATGMVNDLTARVARVEASMKMMMKFILMTRLR